MDPPLPMDGLSALHACSMGRLEATAASSAASLTATLSASHTQVESLHTQLASLLHTCVLHKRGSGAETAARAQAHEESTQRASECARLRAELAALRDVQADAEKASETRLCQSLRDQLDEHTRAHQALQGNLAQVRHLLMFV